MWLVWMSIWACFACIGHASMEHSDNVLRNEKKPNRSPLRNSAKRSKKSMAPNGSTVRNLGKKSKKSMAPSASPSAFPSSQPSLSGDVKIRLCKTDSHGNPVARGEQGYDDAESMFVESVNMGLVSASLDMARDDMDEALAPSSSFLTVFENLDKLTDGLTYAAPFLHLSGIIVHEAENNNAHLPLIETALAEINSHMDDVLTFMRDGFLQVRHKFVDRQVDAYMESLHSLKASYDDYLESLLAEPTAAVNGIHLEVKNERELIFASKCNQVSSMPGDIFRNLYGYACTTCTYGDPKREKVLLTAVADSDGTREGFANVIPKWIISSLTMSAYLYSVCLPPEPIPCLDRPNDTLRNNVLSSMVAAIEEVKEAIQSELDTMPANRRLEEANPNLPIPSHCKKNELDEYIPKEVPEYEFAEYVKSSYTVGQAKTEFEDIGTTIGGVADLAAGFGEIYEKSFGPLSKKLALFGPIASIATHWLSKDDTDITQQLITDEAEKTRAKIEDLANKVDRDIIRVVDAIVNAELDEYSSRLQATTETYFDFMRSKGDVQRAEIFRSTCHQAHFRPEDIMRDLYGYACEGRASENNDCTYAHKKRLDIFDEFKTNAKGSVVYFRQFGHWLLNAMSQAMFLHTVCLPYVGDSCLLPEDDVIFLESLDEMALMMDEVGYKIDQVETEFLQNWRENLFDNNFALLGGISGHDIPGTRDRIYEKITTEFGRFFAFQVIVYNEHPCNDEDETFQSYDVARGIAGGFTSIGTNAWVGGSALGNGALVFDNVGDDMRVHIRYRKRAADGSITTKQGAADLFNARFTSRSCQWEQCCSICGIFADSTTEEFRICQEADHFFEDASKNGYNSNKQCFTSVSYSDSHMKTIAEQDEGYLVLHGTGSGKFFEHFTRRGQGFHDDKVAGLEYDDDDAAHIRVLY